MYVWLTTALDLLDGRENAMAALPINNTISTRMVEAILKAKLPQAPIEVIETWDENDRRYVWIETLDEWDNELEEILEALGQAVGDPSVNDPAV